MHLHALLARAIQHLRRGSLGHRHRARDLLRVREIVHRPGRVVGQRAGRLDVVVNRDISTPGREIHDKRQTSVVDSQFASENCLRHRGHANEIGTITFQTINLRRGFEPGALRSRVRAAIRTFDTSRLGGSQQVGTHIG